MKDFRDLKVWEKAHSLALICYQITASFPKAGDFWDCFTDQKIWLFRRGKYR